MSAMPCAGIVIEDDARPNIRRRRRPAVNIVLDGVSGLRVYDWA
jgi:hypothetical protein